MKAPTTLLFTAEEAASKYSAFFKLYPISVEDSAIPSVFKDFFEVSKKNLREFFPLDGEGRVLIAKYEDTDYLKSRSLPATTDALLDVAYKLDNSGKDYSIYSIRHNKLANGSKFSKRLVSLYAAAKKAEDKNPDRFLRSIESRVKERLILQDLCLELPRLPLDKRDDLEVVLQNYYSELAVISKTKMLMYLSVNPYDIANASNNAKFTSCNKIGGMYESAPISAASSEHMAMLRLESEDGELLGRCYISFSPDMKSYVVQPVYGYMQESFVTDAKTWLQVVIDNKLGSTCAWKEHRGDLGIPMEYLVNDTSAVFYVDQSSSCMFREDFSAIPSVRVAGCRCLVCGKSSKNLLCNTCKKTKLHKCACCGKFISVNDKYCAECASKVKSCPRCGEIFSSDNSVCDKCNHYTSFCIVCGGSFKIREDGKSLGIIGIVPGMLHAHKHCLQTDTYKPNYTCPYCGIQHSFSYAGCGFCTSKREAKENAKYMLNTFSSARRKLTYDSCSKSYAMNDRIILPDFCKEGYAIAA